MSDSTIGHIMQRIEGSTEDSPIAVFRCSKPGKLNAVFAATVMTQAKINEPEYIGTYNGSMNMGFVRQKLMRHING